MALRVPAAMALCLLISLMAAAHCAVVVPHEEAADDLAIGKDSSSAAVTAVDGEGLLRLPLPSREESAVPDEVDAAEREVPVEPVAEPDPDRSSPDSDDGEEEELTASKKLGEEKTEEQIGEDEDEDEKEKKLNKNRDGDGKEEKKKRKKQHSGDGKGKKKKEKKTKKHQSNDDEEEEEVEELKKKQVHRVEKVKTKKRPCHHKNRSNDGDDSDDEDDEHEKKAKRWMKKAISRSLFGHVRRSQREEAAKEEVNN